MDFETILSKRRSATFFDKDKELSLEIVKDIINNATLAPSCFNTQPWRVIVIKSKEAREELFEKACKQPKVKEAPVTLAILGDTRGYERDNPIWNVKLNDGRIDEESIGNIISMCNNNLFNTSDKKVAYAIRNSSLFAMCVMLEAENRGVSSHPMIGFNGDMLKEMYDIPDHMEITMLITLGHFDESKTLYPREKRFLYNDIVKEY